MRSRESCHIVWNSDPLLSFFEPCVGVNFLQRVFKRMSLQRFAQVTVKAEIQEPLFVALKSLCCQRKNSRTFCANALNREECLMGLEI